MKLAEYAARHRPRIERTLRDSTQFSSSFSPTWAHDVEARFIGMAGGKALRGILALIGVEVAGAHLHKDAFQLAAAIELMHAMFLVHDDVMDRDLVRRGKPSLFAQYAQRAPKGADAQHAGTSLALCAGDVGILRASGMLASLAASSPAGARAADTIISCCIETGFGQMSDFALGVGIGSAPDEATIISMLTSKTAQYTCSMPLAAGALLGGGSSRLARQLSSLGEDLGFIFQIRDDELGLFGTAEMIGKPAGSDIREGKQTLFALYLREAASRIELKRLATIYGNPTASDDDFAYVRDLTRRYGVDTRVASMIAEREKRAARTIARLRITESSRELLTDTLAFVSRRTT